VFRCIWLRSSRWLLSGRWRRSNINRWLANTKVVIIIAIIIIIGLPLRAGDVRAGLRGRFGRIILLGSLCLLGLLLGLLLLTL